MKKSERIIAALFSICLIFSVLTLSLLSYFNEILADNYTVVNGKELKLNNGNCISIMSDDDGEKPASHQMNQIGFKEVSIRLFGIIPVKNAKIETADESYVYVSGKPFGIKLFTDGVLIVGINTVKTKDGESCPADNAGLQVGDSITTVNGKKVNNNEELSAMIAGSEGKIILVQALRNGKNFTARLKAVLSEETGTYKAGIWVRDSTAGIGTMTFYSPYTGIACGLGHGICDNDTESLLRTSSGELVFAEILSCNRSSSGCPGELIGRFSSGKIANLKLNSETGVYGSYDIAKISTDNLMSIAPKQEIVNGKGKILTTINGTEPQYYDCEIKVKNLSDSQQTQNMIITITDKNLIEKTGGIVQGMSGSPVIQNGRLIGAVTHVLVDDPTKGYAIFAENMLETAQGVAEEKFRDAS